MDYHADQTELFQILNHGHHGVELTKEEWEKMSCWIDLNVPYHGRRSDIPGYERTLGSRTLKAKYAPMFGVELEDIEWLPELPKTPQPILPKRARKPVGDTIQIAGWPHYKPQEAHGNPEWSQLNLGEYLTSIDLGDGVKLELAKVPAGSYRMGSTRKENEMPLSVQIIEKPFWIGRFEISNRQYALFDPTHDSRLESGHNWLHARLGFPLNNPDQPVVRVSWSEAMAFCRWLSEKTGLKVTLPTEAEWEWACRAGNDAAYSFGEPGTDYSLYANLGDKRISEYAERTTHKFYESNSIILNPNRYDDWVPHDTIIDDKEFVSSEIGNYKANPWDLYDMHGNVWEWTRSVYLPYPYKDDDGRNDVTFNGFLRTIRGGSWYDRPHKATSTYRIGYSDYSKVFNVGFRIVMYEDDDTVNFSYTRN
jgi:formylglycine-generating enzyme required for sulfatase activity